MCSYAVAASDDRPESFCEDGTSLFAASGRGPTYPSVAIHPVVAFIQGKNPSSLQLLWRRVTEVACCVLKQKERTTVLSSPRRSSRCLSVTSSFCWHRGENHDKSPYCCSSLCLWRNRARRYLLRVTKSIVRTLWNRLKADCRVTAENKRRLVSVCSLGQGLYRSYKDESNSTRCHDVVVYLNATNRMSTTREIP